MEQLIKLGRILYCIGLISMGIHQILLQDFREEIVPPFPHLLHQYTIFPIIAGLALIFAGAAITGLFRIKSISTRKICLYLGFCFLMVVVIFHLPYMLFFSPDKIWRLDVWFGPGEAFAYSGGAFVIAGSYPNSDVHKSAFELFLERLIPCGRIFFSVLMILFGLSHFILTDFVSTMVPKLLGAPIFWTYFAGVALIGAGVAIILKIWIRTVALLLAFMLLLFFLFFHIPDAMANPSVGKGNELVRAIICMMFSGIALVIAGTNKKSNLA